ncbi:MAG: hypothetical protein KDK38_15345 [Leptospiraceae bacterium]|nr:hypothetical protein [Leptospiraceae bacterium]
MNGIPTPIEEVTLTKLITPELKTLFDEALKKVKDNCKDERCWHGYARKIHLEIVISPDSDRQGATLFCKLNTKLAPVQVKHLIDLTHQQYFHEQGFRIQEVRK